MPYGIGNREYYKRSEIESSCSYKKIKFLLGHSATRTTEIYSHVANSSFIKIKDLLS